MRSMLLLLSGIIILSSCGYQRIGDLTMISNRNVDSGKEYIVLQRNGQGVAKMKKDDALELAIDNATEKYEGEYLMNVKVYVKGNGKKIKVEGDVYGLKSAATHTTVDVESSVTKKIEFETGDTVSFKNSGKFVEGRIVGINSDGALVEFNNIIGKLTKKEIPFDDLTKIER
ncbi:MAG: hypothetical protein QNK85_11015 [Crocinitomicaceae bacterium]